MTITANQNGSFSIAGTGVLFSGPGKDGPWSCYGGLVAGGSVFTFDKDHLWVREDEGEARALPVVTPTPPKAVPSPASVKPQPTLSNARR